MDNNYHAPTATEACQTLSQAINSSGFNRKAYFETFQNEHRYLQSEMFELCLYIIRQVAKDSYLTDGRNEWCQRKAKEIVGVIGE